MQILSAKYIFTMTGAPLVGGAVAVENGEIIDVGREDELLKRYTGAVHEDYNHHVIMPGLINCHTHLDMCHYKDFPGDPVRSQPRAVNFVEWLMGCIQFKKTADQTLHHQSVEWGIDECIQSGTTCIADMSSYVGVFHAAERKNIRAVLFPEVLSITTEVTKDLFENALGLIEQYLEDDSDLISVGMGPYSPYTLSRNLLRIMSQYSRSSQIPIMIHVGESFSEMEFFHNTTGDIATRLFPDIGWDDLPPEYQITPIQHLSKIGFLESQPLLVGCNHATEMDLMHIAQSGAKVVLTPRSNEFLQQGQAPYRDMREKHIHTVLGTDGIPSVDTLSLWDEMRAFVRQQSPHAPLTGFDVLSMVTSRAASALGLGDEVGTIEKGKRADLILIDLDGISEQGDLEMNIIKNVCNAHIKSVMIGGKNVKSIS